MANMTSAHANEAPLSYEEAREIAITFGVPLPRRFRAYAAKWEYIQMGLPLGAR